MTIRSLPAAVILILSLACSYGQVVSIPHSHNDYEHTQPLMEAITAGFRSVEADVHLKYGKLLVGHNAVNRRSPELSRLYLIPLNELFKQGILTEKDQPFYLMIDLKTDGEKTLTALEEELKRFPDWLNLNSPVRIVLSGNVPKQQMLSEEFRGIRIDGRPDDVGRNISADRMPWVSDRFSNWGAGDGNGDISTTSLEKISALAMRVHAEGKLLRLWATPDHPTAWKQLQQAGVDLLNTDRLTEMRKFLTGN
ncbi:MAG: hypothetical protein ACKOYP_14895 [Bacteroidota bacterium]